MEARLSSRFLASRIWRARKEESLIVAIVERGSLTERVLLSIGEIVWVWCLLNGQVLPTYSLMYLCSTKTREVLGNPSPKPERFPEGEARGKSWGRNLREGMAFPIPPWDLVEYHQSLSRGWFRKSFSVHREGLTVLKSMTREWKMLLSLGISVTRQFYWQTMLFLNNSMGTLISALR